MILPPIIFPVYEKEYTIRLSPDIVRKKISNLTQKGYFILREVFVPANLKKPFCGEINDYSFKIFRNVGYANPFLPIICGQIFSENGKTKIKLLMRIHYVFLSFFILIFVLPTVFISFFALTKTGLLGFLMFFIALIFEYLFVIVPFNIEANMSYKILNRALGLSEDK